MFAVYNVQKRSIKIGWHAPKSHFYVPDHNSMKVNGILMDIPEQAFSVMDHRMSVIFQKLQGCAGVPKMTVDEMVGLWYFLSNLFWRSPGNDVRFEKTLDIAEARSQLSILNTANATRGGRPPEPIAIRRRCHPFHAPTSWVSICSESEGQNFRH